MKKTLISILTFSLSLSHTAVAEVKFPWKDPGTAKIECDTASATLSNRMFSASFRKAGKGVVFDGMKMSNGKEVAQSGTHLFTITLENGTTYTSKDLLSSTLTEVRLKADDEHPQLAQRIPGVAVSCTFTTPDKALDIKWRAVLRNGSHYLRQEMEICAARDTRFSKLTPVQYNLLAGGTPVVSGNTTHGKVVINDLLFCGLETPMSVMTAPGGTADTAGGWNPEEWNADAFTPAFNVPASMGEKYGKAFARMDGPVVVGLMAAEGPVTFSEKGSCSIKISGGLDVVAVQLFPEGSETPAGEDVHKASSGSTYKVEVPEPGTYTLKIWVDTRKAGIDGDGKITYSLPTERRDNGSEAERDASLVQGEWVRNTILQRGQSWKVSSVLASLPPDSSAVPSWLTVNVNEPPPTDCSFITTIGTKSASLSTITRTRLNAIRKNGSSTRLIPGSVKCSRNVRLPSIAL